jgi:Deoxyinosine 3''endonuclease (endonuclease V)
MESVDLPGEALQLVRQIPAGSVTTYGDLARALGDEATRAARWLGELIAHHEHTPDCPCHRVVRSNGEIGLYVTGSPQDKARLLTKEGVAVSETGQVDLSLRFTDFQSTRPLERLRNFQYSLRPRLKQTTLRTKVRTVSGVDVAYGSDGTARGAFVTLEARTGEVLEIRTLRWETNFPYIPGYLTFRELPVMVRLCRQAQEEGILGDVLFCDGNGQLHPWQAGIATCLGVLLDHPTIGVGKSLLCGRIRSESANPAAIPVELNGKQIGMAIRLSEKHRPVYISVGHRLKLDQAAEIARQSFQTHRVPEPIFHADRITRRYEYWADDDAIKSGSD